MKKPISYLLSTAFLLMTFVAVCYSQDVDLSGIWVGTTEVPDSPEPDQVTLILEKKDGVYQGTLTDTAGYAKDTELNDIELSGNKLSFNFTVYNGQDYVKIYISLTVEGDRMTGKWESQEGDSSPIVLERKT